MSHNRKNSIKNVCIVGVGGVGGFFGGKIAYKIAKEKIDATKVYFIARGEHLQKIQSEGLILNTVERQNMVCHPSLATDNIAEIPSPDLCLLCVKSYDLENAVTSLEQKISRISVQMTSTIMSRANFFFFRHFNITDFHNLLAPGVERTAARRIARFSIEPPFACFASCSAASTRWARSACR